jgi:hypothetical protein
MLCHPALSPLYLLAGVGDDGERLSSLLKLAGRWSFFEMLERIGINAYTSHMLAINRGQADLLSTYNPELIHHQSRRTKEPWRILYAMEVSTSPIW